MDTAIDISFYMKSLNLTTLRQTGMNLSTEMVYGFYKRIELFIDKSYFTEFYTYEHGRCHTLNIDKIRAEVQGMFDSLDDDIESFEILLFVDPDDIIQHISGDIGYQLVLHDENELPNFKKNTFDVQPGYKTTIKVKKVTHTRLSSPFSNCADQLPLSTNSTFKMSQKLCYNQCFAAQMSKDCKCHLQTIPELDSTVLEKNISCFEIKDLGCAEDISYDRCNCPPPCRIVNYETESAQIEWPSPFLARLLINDLCNSDDSKCHLKNKSDSELSRCFASFKIKYESNSYTSFKDVPKMTKTQFAMEVIEIVGTMFGISGNGIAEKLTKVSHRIMTYPST